MLLFQFKIFKLINFIIDSGPKSKLSIYGPTALLLVDFSGLFIFLILYIVAKTSLSRDQPVARPVPTHRTTQTQNKCKHKSLP
jgi:hypothetical protein